MLITSALFLLQESTRYASKTTTHTVAGSSCLPVSDIENDEVTLIGLVTLEDLVEEILQSEIVDETDSVLDNAKVTELFCCEAKSERLSLSMLSVVIRWLAGQHMFFTEEHMESRVLERLIQKNIHHVILLPGRKEKCVYIYEAEVPSRRFVLILEGTAIVTFSKINMTFEVGPWTSFGECLFQKISSTFRSRQDNRLGMKFTPDFSLKVHQRCRFLQLPITAVLHALRISRLIRHLRTPNASVSEEDDHVPVLLGGHGKGKSEHGIQYLQIAKKIAMAEYGEGCGSWQRRRSGNVSLK
ncbi:hypothetical protein OESDEN_00195 [Oesophagostomum dentatum]|uniref:CBS domain protein n=1 Tax=Oesophagostomum dentatum TaxID=61180 RepID=A0A0B1TRA4_OESDE|nr:hypothetical protein OESDEN_00195 [Oesophagostomum dentatum]